MTDTIHKFYSISILEITSSFVSILSHMSNSSSSLDPIYIVASMDIYLYGYTLVMCIGLIGNICQIITFSQKLMQSLSTGILFLAMSISDTKYILQCLYVVLIYGFKVSDRSNYGQTCQFRHFMNYLSTNFSAWMLTTSM